MKLKKKKRFLTDRLVVVLLTSWTGNDYSPKQARKIRLKFCSSEDDQFWISGRPHKLSGCPGDKDVS